MNPELLRNVWLELTSRRLIATPLVLGTILWGLAQIGAAAGVAGVLFIVFTVLWGTFQAGDAVASEVGEHTWDWQRLSTLTGWELTWGKLLGSTLYTWYAALICLGVRFFLLLPEHGLVPMIHVTAFLIGGALLGQAAAFLLGLQTVRVRGHRTRIGTLISQLIGVLIGMMIIAMGSFLPGGMLGSLQLIKIELAPEVDWYGIVLTAPTVATVTLIVCLAWALLGAHRVMLREMAHRVQPWAWPSFVGFACFYMAGFEPAAMSAAGVAITARAAGWLVTAAGVSAVLTYAALLWDEKDPVTFRRLLRLSDAGDVKAFASYLPSYFMSFLITVVLALLLLIVGGGGDRDGVMIWPAVIGVLLYMFRDICINLYFGLAPHHDRANLMTLIVLGLLYGLAPVLLFIAGWKVTYLLIPFWPGPWYGVLAAGLLQAAVAALLVTRRWRKRFVLAAA